MEISLANLETTSGEYQAYWLILLSKQRVMPSQYAASGLKQHLDAVKTITDRGTRDAFMFTFTLWLWCKCK